MRCSVGVFGGDELHAQPLDAVNGLAVADRLDDVHGVTREEACGVGDGEGELAFLQLGDGPLIEALGSDDDVILLAGGLDGVPDTLGHAVVLDEECLQVGVGSDDVFRGSLGLLGIPVAVLRGDDLDVGVLGQLFFEAGGTLLGVVSTGQAGDDGDLALIGEGF